MAHQHNGHRARLLRRFEHGGLSALHDYEIIELLLTFVLPRRDTKPIAKKVLARYKTLTAALNASNAEMRELGGIGPRTAAYFSLLREVISYCLHEKFQGESVISHWKDVVEFLRFTFGMKRDEYIAVLFLDSGNHLLNTEIVGEGTVNQCAVHPRKIMDRAFQHGAASLILAHNHPGGALVPSEADWTLTERIHRAAHLLDITLLDHIIISRHTAVSLRELPRWPR